MKTIVINASPRRKWNTAQLMKEAAKGAESVGAEVEYIDLYKLDLHGCMSCLICKKEGKIFFFSKEMFNFAFESLNP